MESLIADFISVLCPNYEKFCFELLAKKSSSIGDISKVLSIFTKFPVAFFSGGGDKAVFCISRDHMINESRDWVSELTNWSKCC